MACFIRFLSVVAAATENNDDSEDDDPGAVIVEKMAKAVVIHSMFLRRMIAMLHRLVYNMLKNAYVTLMKKQLPKHLKVSMYFYQG